MSVFSANVWIGKGNDFKLLLTSKMSGGAEGPAELDLVDSMELELRDTAGAITVITVTSGQANPPLDWWDDALTTGQVMFDLGLWAEDSGPDGDPFPEGVYEARLIVYSATVNEGRGTVWLSWVNNDMSVRFIA